jgi:hypothetical protein
MPDDELLNLADAGQLTAQLQGQVRRLLQDPRAGTLVQSFAMQWLQLQRLDLVSPDATLFPGWNSELRQSMRRETELFIESILREDRSLLELIGADYTFLNGPLARHYGIVDTNGNAEGQSPTQPAGQPIQGSEFVRVSLAGSARHIQPDSHFSGEAWSVGAGADSWCTTSGTTPECSRATECSGGHCGGTSEEASGGASCESGLCELSCEDGSHRVCPGEF